MFARQRRQRAHRHRPATEYDSGPILPVRVKQLQPHLHRAIEQGHVDQVRQILREGAYAVNSVDRWGHTALHRAAGRGQVDMVRVLIAEFKADVNAHNDSGETALHRAASGGYSSVVRVLIAEFKADINARNNGGETALHKAASGGYLSVVRVLISKLKADVNAYTKNGSTPFDVAVRNNRQEVAVVLVNESHCDTMWGTPYIQTACERGWVNLLQALVQKHGTGIMNRYGIHNILAKENKHAHEMALMLAKNFGSRVRDREGQSSRTVLSREILMNLTANKPNNN